MASPAHSTDGAGPASGVGQDTVASLLEEISTVGRDPARGGYTRPVYSAAEHDLRDWFVGHARKRDLDVEVDRNGVVWAWSGGIGDGAVVTGSHLDSVPGGGAYDGPLGVASALVAFDQLQARGVPGRRAIAVFPEEEGSRFGMACLGSRLMTGTLDPDRARALTDADGVTFAVAAQRGGLDPAHLGPDPEALGRMAAFVELHVEQGRGLVDLGRPVAVATSILGHGRWRVSITGEGNHAGTTGMTDRRDPMVAASAFVLAARDLARRTPGARATVGRLTPRPGGTNVIASRVDLWLDLRHGDGPTLRHLVADLTARACTLAQQEGCFAEVVEESVSPTVDFDAGLAAQLRETLDGAPLLPTGAGHDAGVLKDHVRTAMLFVRNPTGVSHAPAESVEADDAEVGATALAECLGGLLAAPWPSSSRSGSAPSRPGSVTGW